LYGVALPQGFDSNKRDFVYCSSILLCGSIVYLVFVVIIFVDLFRFLTSGIRALSLADIVGKYFYFYRFFFGEEKRVVTFQTFLVYFCEKIAETGCIPEFLSEKNPI
jgi:hypothetical protein